MGIEENGEGFVASAKRKSLSLKIPQSSVSPKKKRNLILAFLIGIFGGIGLCFLIDRLDNTIKGPEDLEKLVALPSLGVIPFLSPEGMKRKKLYGYYAKHKNYGLHSTKNPGKESKGKIPDIKDIALVNHLYPKISISEDYRTVRTSILLSRADNPPKIIAFSSALPLEGKSITVANMAVAFAQLGKRVLIVDADLRRPQQHRLFKVRNVRGLSGYLTGNVPAEDVTQETKVDNVSIIPSGIIPPNPAELLDSEKMKMLLEGLKEAFDIVLIDTPPLLAVVDPTIIGSFSDCVVLIVQPEKTKDKPFLKAVKILNQSKVKVLGVVFNKAIVGKGSYYYMDYYYQYRQDYITEEKSGLSTS